MTNASANAVRYFEDYAPGFTADCGSFSLDEPQIIAFGEQYDPQPFHVDPKAAKEGPFGGLVASGWHTASRTMRNMVEHFISPETSLGGLGIDEIRWTRPVRPGDTVHVSVTVLEARRSRSKPDRGIIRSQITVTNQDGYKAMTMTAISGVLARSVPGIE